MEPVHKCKLLVSLETLGPVIISCRELYLYTRGVSWSLLGLFSIWLMPSQPRIKSSQKIHHSKMKQSKIRIRYISRKYSTHHQVENSAKLYFYSMPLNGSQECLTSSVEGETETYSGQLTYNDTCSYSQPDIILEVESGS